MVDVNSLMNQKSQGVINDSGSLFNFEDIIISYPNLIEPTTNAQFPGSPPSYSAQVIMTQDQLQKFLEAIEAHIKSHDLPPMPDMNLTSLYIKYLDDEKKFGSNPRLFKKFSRTFYTQFSPVVGKIDTHLGQLVKLDGPQISTELYAGCEANVQIKIRHRKGPTVTPGTYSFFLQQVIKTADGDTFGESEVVLGANMNMDKYIKSTPTPFKASKEDIAKVMGGLEDE